MNRRGVDHQIGIMDEVGAVRRREPETLPPQAIHLDSIRFVGAADTMTKSQQEGGNPTHSRTGNTDQMNA